MPRKPTCDCGACAKCRTRERTRRHRASGRAKPDQAAQRAAWRVYNAKRDPIQRQAHSRVLTALRNGTLHREPCEVCGVEDTEAHHDDYSKPLDVRWLCPQHHTDHHMKEAVPTPNH